MVNSDLEIYKSRGPLAGNHQLPPSPSSTMQLFTKSSFTTLALLLLSVNVGEAMPTQNDNEQATCVSLGGE
jgi:hypothetical protein